MAAIKINRSTARLLLGGFAAIVIVVALVLWPRPTSVPPSNPDQAAVTITPVPNLPQGAMACDVVYPEVTGPFNAGARGTPMTTCSFVEQVRRTYANTQGSPRPTQLNVVSPATRKWYNVSCFQVQEGDYVTCTGGQGAVVYLYNKR